MQILFGRYQNVESFFVCCPLDTFSNSLYVIENGLARKVLTNIIPCLNYLSPMRSLSGTRIVCSVQGATLFVGYCMECEQRFLGAPSTLNTWPVLCLFSI